MVLVLLFTASGGHFTRETFLRIDGLKMINFTMKFTEVMIIAPLRNCLKI